MLGFIIYMENFIRLADDATEKQIDASEEHYMKVETVLSEDTDSNSWQQIHQTTKNENTKLKKKIRKHTKCTKRTLLDKTKTRKICYDCLKSFNTQADYDTHIAQHTTQKYACDYDNCKTEFVSYLKYALHRKNDHFIKDYLSCKECQRNFSNKLSFDVSFLNLNDLFVK